LDNSRDCDSSADINDSRTALAKRETGDAVKQDIRTRDADVLSIMESIAKKNAGQTVDALLTEELLNFLLDEGERRFKTVEERRAFVVGGACTLGFYGKEFKRGLEKSE
jgi:hypothetical protein